MLETRFSEKEMTTICQILKEHGTDCTTLVDVLKMANSAAPNDAITTYKHVRLMKEFGVIQDITLLCHTCVMDVINHHADTCKEYKERMKAKFFCPCPDDHYDYSKCEHAVWMVDTPKIYSLEEKAAFDEWSKGKVENITSYCDERNGVEVVVRRFNHEGRTMWLEKTFPDILPELRFNPWMGFLCEKHIGSMKPYADKIIGYR